MSRLYDYIENSKQLDTLNLILKQHVVNAEFVTTTLTKVFGEDKELPKELLEDLNQFQATL
ncbi:hypothetical protein [Paenibacillus mendelii]|uniref:Spore coat protein n=1 Tax=Paenibacillus mendelii TaxID=206163 RepID=A0ABV6JIP5_9BACL|nr:hypothetical protein [Paenibacillus mendelii]MCQ6558707.1 hypothetical protein [Paenibacillus mendelii]